MGLGKWIKKQARNVASLATALPEIAIGTSPSSSSSQNQLLGQLSGALGGGVAPKGVAAVQTASAPVAPAAVAVSPASGVGAVQTSSATTPPVVAALAQSGASIKTSASAQTKPISTLPEIVITAKPPTVWQRIKGWVMTGYNWLYVVGGVIVLLLGGWLLWRNGSVGSSSPAKRSAGGVFRRED